MSRIKAQDLNEHDLWDVKMIVFPSIFLLCYSLVGKVTANVASTSGTCSTTAKTTFDLMMDRMTNGDGGMMMMMRRRLLCLTLTKHLSRVLEKNDNQVLHL